MELNVLIDGCLPKYISENDSQVYNVNCSFSPEILNWLCNCEKYIAHIFHIYCMCQKTPQFHDIIVWNISLCYIIRGQWNV